MRDRGEFVERLSPEPSAAFRETASIPIGEAKPFGIDARTEVSILFPQIIDGSLLMPVEPARHHHHEKLDEHGHRSSVSISAVDAMSTRGPSGEPMTEVGDQTKTAGGALTPSGRDD